MKIKISFIASLGILSLTQASPSYADNINGKNLYIQRCAMCHGTDIKGTGPLANKSNPPTPDLTTSAFKKRLKDYPGVIVSSVILRPNGDLIPKTLRENGVKISPYAWKVQDFRDFESIHEWCDFKESIDFRQDWCAKLPLEDSKGAKAANEHRNSSEYQECDKKPVK